MLMTQALIRLSANLGVLLFIGGLGSVVVMSWVLLLRAFRENVFWGLACLFFPIAGFLFVVRYWLEMRRLAIGYLAGLGVMLLGLGFLSLAPDLRQAVAEGFAQQQARLVALRKGSEPEDPNGPSLALRQQEAQYERSERERATAMEMHQRASELFCLVQAWREELMSRQPGEEATEEERERFRLEHKNYTGLLNEYKQAAREVEKLALTRPATAPAAKTTTAPGALPEAPVRPAAPEAVGS